jgi:D-sedoheptulose 7-phosphate isomerase
MMNKSTVVNKNFLDSIELKQSLLADQKMIDLIVRISDLIIAGYRNGKKVLFCGNGGSAADAQHLAAEFSGRYYYDRAPLFAEALHVNTSYLTAVANDYSFDHVYERMVKAMGETGDIIIGLSTSGNSENVLKALKEAKAIGMSTIAFTGNGGGKMKDVCEFIIDIPSTDTPRIQECHMLIGHTVCQIVEAELFPQD